LALSAGVDTRLAGGTSLAVIALNSTAGLVGQLRYARMDWGLVARFVLYAFIGILSGIAVAHRMPEKVLRRAFGVTLIVIGVAITSLNI
jgi:uncharacterized membrane protein YfcA